MVAVVYWLPTGRLLAQADWLGQKVGGHWCCFCSHHVALFEVHLVQSARQLHLTVLRLSQFCPNYNCGSTQQANHNHRCRLLEMTVGRI